MKRGKDEDKNIGPMFPRLHVNDTEKGGPRAPPRNKMALYEQLSIPSQRFNGGASTFNPNSTANSLPPSSSTPGPINERGTRHSDFNTQRVQQEHKDDDFRVPIFDQQSGTSQTRNTNNQNRETEGFSGRLANLHNARQTNNKSQKENSQDFARSAASNQMLRQVQNFKVPLKETNAASSFSQRNGSDNLRGHRVDSQADNSLWGDSGLNENNLVQEEVVRSPNDAVNGDAVSETSMVDSICGVDISPDDVVGIIGQKHFWKARRAIVNQQRVFAVQVFELHRLIKVQKLIAGSPQLLFEENAYLSKPPKVFPVKKIPIEYLIKPKHKNDKNALEKTNDEPEFSAENAVGKASLSSVQNGSQTTYCRPFSGNPLPPPPPPSDPNMGSWNLTPPPGHQWLIPVMSPSEGLVYKPYPGPGFPSPSPTPSPVYGGFGPTPGSMPMIGHNFPNYGVPGYEGLTGVQPFAPPASHGYFPAYGMPPPANPPPPPPVSISRSPLNLQHQSSSNVQIDKNVLKFKAFKDREVQASTASSQSRNPLPLFPTTPPAPVEAPAVAPVAAPVERVEPPRVIRVVPHNARSATASVARIFRSIQEERKQYDSG